MSASAEAALTRAMHDALEAREGARRHLVWERRATIRFMDEALHNHWSWPKIGEALGITDTAARRYYERNRRKVRIPA